MYVKQNVFEKLLTLNKCQFIRGDDCTYLIEDSDNIIVALNKMGFVIEADKLSSYLRKGDTIIRSISAEYSESIVCAINRKLRYRLKKAKREIDGAYYTLTTIVDGERIYLYAKANGSILASTPLTIKCTTKIERNRENKKWLKSFVDSLNLPENIVIPQYPKKGEINYVELIIPNTYGIVL
jgi:hypothetical protein